MTSKSSASIKARTTKRAAARSAAGRVVQLTEQTSAPAVNTAGVKQSAQINQAKHRRLNEMLHDLRLRAEALSSNADSLLSRLS